MSSPVQCSRKGAIALITIDHPPVNALGQPVRATLLEAFQLAEGDERVQAVVLSCAGKTFIAGADIKEFGQPPQAPLLPQVVEAIAACTKPSIAVLHGSALGGGLEVAMACHYRIARCDSTLGLPEVKLGLIPGAGGTQRLPRLVGVARALRMITSGTAIGTAEALACGLVDDWFDGEPQVAGLAFAERLLAGQCDPRRSGEQDRKLQVSNAAELFAAKRREVAQRMPGLISPQRAIDAIEAATRLPLAEGLACERALFLECLQSPQRAALVEAFFAERKARKHAATPPRASLGATADAATLGVGERMMLQLIREAELLLEEGATPEQVDAALQGFGMAMGPFVMQDLSGLDSWQRLRQRASQAEGRLQPAILDRLCAAGRLGQKSAAGYYRYDNGSRDPQPDPQLTQLWGARGQGMAFSDSDIVERGLYALINEGARLLEEGVVQRASDIDALFLTGYGFPAWRGGPMCHADRVGLGRVLARTRDFQQRYGTSWQPAALLKRLVAEERTFADWDAAR